MRYTLRSSSRRWQIHTAVWECLDTAALVRQAREAYIDGRLEIDTATLACLANVRANLAMHLVRFHDADWRGWATAAELDEIRRIETEASAVLRCCGHREELCPGLPRTAAQVVR